MALELRHCRRHHSVCKVFQLQRRFWQKKICKYQ